MINYNNFVMLNRALVCHRVLPLVSVSGIDILQEKKKIIKHFLSNWVYTCIAFSL